MIKYIISEQNSLARFFNKVIFFALLFFVYIPLLSFFSDDQAARAYRAKDYATARAVYASQVECEPDNCQALYNLGKTAGKLADFETAQKCFEKAAYNTHAEQLLQEQAAFELGDCYFQSDQLDNALRAYMRVLELNNKNMHARKRIEMLKKRQEQNQEKKELEKPEKNSSEQDKEKNKSNDREKQNQPEKRDTKKPDNGKSEQTNNTGEQTEQDKKTEQDKRTDHDKQGAGKNSQEQHQQEQNKTEHDKLRTEQQDSTGKPKQDMQKQQEAKVRASDKLNQQEKKLLEFIEQADTNSYRQLIKQEVKQTAGLYNETNNW